MVATESATLAELAKTNATLTSTNATLTATILKLTKVVKDLMEVKKCGGSGGGGGGVGGGVRGDAKHCPNCKRDTWHKPDEFQTSEKQGTPSATSTLSWSRRRPRWGASDSPVPTTTGKTLTR